MVVPQAAGSLIHTQQNKTNGWVVFRNTDYVSRTTVVVCIECGEERECSRAARDDRISESVITWLVSESETGFELLISSK
jgi:hypothetical protein